MLPVDWVTAPWTPVTDLPTRGEPVKLSSVSGWVTLGGALLVGVPKRPCLWRMIKIWADDQKFCGLLSLGVSVFVVWLLIYNPSLTIRNSSRLLPLCFYCWFKPCRSDLWVIIICLECVLNLSDDVEKMCARRTMIARKMMAAEDNERRIGRKKIPISSKYEPAVLAAHLWFCSNDGEYVQTHCSVTVRTHYLWCFLIYLVIMWCIC